MIALAAWTLVLSGLFTYSLWMVKAPKVMLMTTLVMALIVAIPVALLYLAAWLELGPLSIG